MDIGRIYIVIVEVEAVVAKKFMEKYLAFRDGHTNSPKVYEGCCYLVEALLIFHIKSPTIMRQHNFQIILDRLIKIGGPSSEAIHFDDPLPLVY